MENNQIFKNIAETHTNIVNGFLTKVQRHFYQERIVAALNGAGAVGCQHVNIEPRHGPYTFHKSELKMDRWGQKLYSFWKKYLGESLDDLEFDDEFLDIILKHGL